MADDSQIIAALDSNWMTVPAVHKRLGYAGLACQLSTTLRRLSAEGKIEVSRRITTASRYRERVAGRYSIYCYRRLEPPDAEGIDDPG